jgi:predicted DNA-binding protein (MmcQ/YjbR family)
MASSLRQVAKRLARKAAAYPGAVADSPWGDDVYKVRGKIFIFLGATRDGLQLSVKLPASSDAALLLPFTEPTGYGLGKAGWVSASFASGETIPEGLLLEWLDESYRAIAPKKLVSLLDAPQGGSPAVLKPRARTRARRKAKPAAR